MLRLTKAVSLGPAVPDSSFSVTTTLTNVPMLPSLKVQSAVAELPTMRSRSRVLVPWARAGAERARVVSRAATAEVRIGILQGLMGATRALYPAVRTAGYSARVAPINPWRIPMRTSAVAALLTTLALSAPALAHGTKTRERLRIVGNSATADWTFNDGNIGTFVSVVVTENDESGTAGPSETAFVSLSISRYDIESGNVLITGRAEVDGSQNFGFHIDHNLNTATLDVHDAIFQDDNSFTFF